MRKAGDQPRSRSKGVRFASANTASSSRPLARSTRVPSTHGLDLSGGGSDDRPQQPQCDGLRDLGCGWSAARAVKPALLQADQRAYGRALLQRVCGAHPRPWAVRGEVPYESENCKLCAMVVVSGVRMHLPEKLFGRNWFELHHEPTGTSLAFDAMGALESWADLSTRALDERRAGRTAWSGKSADRLDRAAWEARWDSSATLQRREEYDWTYRTQYQGEVYVHPRSLDDCDDSSDSMLQTDGRGPRTVDYWEMFRPVCLCTGTRTPRSEADVSNRGRHSAAAVSAPRLEWEESQSPSPHSLSLQGELVDELHSKLYEDYLHDLGIASLTLRFRRYEHGWEMRLRWWAVVNPSCTPQRGLPHARLRDTTYRFLNGGEHLIRDQVEKELYLDEASTGIWNDGVSLNADTMESALRPVLPIPATQSLRLVPCHVSSDPGQDEGQRQQELQEEWTNIVQDNVWETTERASSASTESRGASVGEVTTGARIANGTQGEEVFLLSSNASNDPIDATDPAVALGWSSVLACAWLDTGRISLFSGSKLLWDIPQAAPALESLAFYIPRANGLCAGVGSDRASGGALLSCGVDGHVRAWALSTGALQAELRLQGAVSADQQIRGCPVVQRLAVGARPPAVDTVPGMESADSVQAPRIVAACGRSVFAMRLIRPKATAGAKGGAASAAGQLLAAEPRPALPSMIVDLAFVFSEDRRQPRTVTGAETQPAGGSGGCCSLVVATSTAGVFIWEGAAAVDDHSAPASRHLSIGSSCVSLSVLSPSTEGIGAGTGCLVAGCTDRTVRIWSWMDLIADDVSVPMTFGGFSATARVGADTAGGWFSVGGDGGRAGVDGTVLTVADRSGGLVCWLLSDSSASGPADQRLWALGVESTRGCRLHPSLTAGPVATLVLPPTAVSVGTGSSDPVTVSRDQLGTSFAVCFLL